MSVIRFFGPLIGSLCVAFASAAQTLTLVGTQEVKAWDGEIVSELNCVVTTQVGRNIAAFSGAKLNFVAPVGKSFKKGDLLAEQEGYFLRLALKRLKVELQTAKLDADFNDKEYQRLSALESGLVSQSQLNQHKLNKHKAILEIERLTHEISEQQELVKRLSFRADADGQVTGVTAAVGAFINPGRSILSFYYESEKELSCQSPVNQNSYETVDIGSFTTLDGQGLMVNRIGKQINERSQNRTVFLAIPQQLQDVMEVGRRVKVNQNQSLSSSGMLAKLPSDALTMSSKGKYVWRVSTEGVLSKVDVKVLSNLPDYFLVESSLNAGDKVVTVGKGGLRAEQKVAVRDSGAQKL